MNTKLISLIFDYTSDIFFLRDAFGTSSIFSQFIEIYIHRLIKAGLVR